MSEMDSGVIELAIEKMSFSDFELFGQQFLKNLYGLGFSATGGSKDGGQDGYILNSGETQAKYAQISKEKNPEKKVIKTISRLSESNRSVETLIFVTSQDWPQRDLFEISVQKNHSISLKVYDKRTLVTQILADARLGEIFKGFAGKTIRSILSLKSANSSRLSGRENLSILTYIGIHAESQPNEKDLLVIAVDAAIYQALEGTDPNKEIFKSHDEIIEFVEEKCPSVKSRQHLSISQRLERLSSKKIPLVSGNTQTKIPKMKCTASHGRLEMNWI